MKAITPSLQTVYLDLLQSATAVPPASLRTQEKGGHRYLTAHERHGSTRLYRHVGRADDPDAQARAARLKSEAQDAKRRRSLVAALRRAGVPGPLPNMGKTLEVLANAGLFENGSIVLVGTAAYIGYAAALGFLFPTGLMSTQDIELSVIPLALKGDQKADLLEILRRANPDFVPIWLAPEAHSSPFKFKAPDGLLVETLTSLRRQDESRVEITNLGASAEALPFQDYLIEEPERVVLLHGSGVPVLVPQPARFAVHKLIVAARRPVTEAGKRSKDLEQAATIREVLMNTHPDAWTDALDAARGRGPQWIKHLNASLKQLDKKRLE